MDADTALLAMLGLFNDSQDSGDIMHQALQLITEASGAGRAEIWLLTDPAVPAQMQYSSREVIAVRHVADEDNNSDGTARLVNRVLESGITETASLIKTDGSLDDTSAAASSPVVSNAMGFPVCGADGVAGVLVLTYDGAEAPDEAAYLVASVACPHIGRFLQRARAEGHLQATARELSELASTDSLTGLKNRREFDRALRTIPRQPFAVLSIDVDHLKEINDAHGHAAGDALLRLVGNTLGLMVRGWDVMARVGGDEFAALLPGVGPFGATLVATRMREAMHLLELPTGPVRVTVGWSAAPAGADPASVWHVADECLYKAKAGGRDAVTGCSYERGEAGDIADRSYSEVVTRLLEGAPLHTVFQPIVHLSDGSVMGYEALARPDGFAPLDSVEAVFEAARNAGQIRDLDCLCRRRAVEDARPLPGEVSLFLNMSAAALVDTRHGVDQLLEVLRGVRREPASVVIEITEHERIRDYDALSRILALYRAQGFRFALDDVGEGHSTLEMLISSGSEYLKVGRSLTMTSSRVGSRAAVEATTAFARATGAVVIAEGVENEYVSDLMKAAGIMLGQGFGLGKPTPAADLEDVGAALAGRAALSGLRPRPATDVTVGRLTQ